MAKRPNPVSWDSDDDLLDEEAAGIYAFQLDKDEDLDEDALLALDEEDGDQSGQFHDQQEEQYDEPTLEIMAEGDDLLEEDESTEIHEDTTGTSNYDDVHVTDYHEEITDETQYQQTEEVEEQVHGEKVASESESEEEDDDQKTRGRFKSERSTLVTSQPSRPRTDIPETLEISQTDQAEINKFLEKKGPQKSRGRGGMRPQGRGQAKPLLRAPHQQQQQHFNRPRAPLHNYRAQHRFGSRGMMNMHHQNLRMQNQQFRNHAPFNPNARQQFQPKNRNNMHEFQGPPMQQFGPRNNLLELTNNRIMPNAPPSGMPVPPQNVHFNPRFQSPGPPSGVGGEVRMAWEPVMSSPGPQPRPYMPQPQGNIRGPPPRLAFEQQHFQQHEQGPHPNWNPPPSKEQAVHPQPLLGNRPFPNDQDQRHQPNVGLRQPFSSPPGHHGAPPNPNTSFQGTGINIPYPLGEDQDYRHTRVGPSPHVSGHHPAPLLSTPQPVSSHNIQPPFNHNQHEFQNDFSHMRGSNSFHQNASQTSNHRYVRPLQQMPRGQPNLQEQHYSSHFHHQMESEGLPIQTVVGNSGPVAVPSLSSSLQAHAPLKEQPRPFPGQAPRRKPKSQMNKFNQQKPASFQQQQQRQQQQQQHQITSLSTQAPKPQQPKPSLTPEQLEQQKKLKERAARFSQPSKRLSVDSSEATPPKVAKTIVPTTKTVISLKPKNSSTAADNKTEMTEEEYQRQVQAGLEEQKRRRESVRRKKEELRQTSAEERRLVLEQKLSQKGMSIEDIAGSGDGSRNVLTDPSPLHNPPVSTTEPIQNQQIPIVGQNTVNSEANFTWKKVKIKRAADGKIVIKHIQIPDGHMIKGGKIVPIGMTNESPQVQGAQRVVHVGAQQTVSREMPQGRGQAPQGRGQAPRGRGQAPRGRGQAPRGRGLPQGGANNTQGRGRAPQSRGNPQLPGQAQQGRGQPLAQAQNINIRGSASRARGRGLAGQTSANKSIQLVRQVSKTMTSNPEQKELIWGCPGMDPNTPVKKVVRRVSTGSEQATEKSGQCHRIVLSGGAPAPTRTVSINNNGAQSAPEKHRRVVMAGGGDAPVITNPLAVIEGLATDTTDKSVRDLAKRVGAISSLSLDRGEKKAYIQFQESTHAELFARKFNRAMLGLSVITVSLVDS